MCLHHVEACAKVVFVNRQNKTIKKFEGENCYSPLSRAFSMLKEHLNTMRCLDL